MPRPSKRNFTRVTNGRMLSTRKRDGPMAARAAPSDDHKRRAPSMDGEEEQGGAPADKNDQEEDWEDGDSQGAGGQSMLN